MVTSWREVSGHLPWRTRQIELYRGEQAQLKHVATLFEADRLESPLLPGFSCLVASLFGK